MSKKYYITTPIYYVNDIPHIGHAYTNLAADVLARSHRLDGYDVMYTTGTDEHGQKVYNAALDKGIKPQDFVDSVSQNFQDLSNTMSFSNDKFVRTTAETHKDFVKVFWKILEDKGYIYLSKYSGWYSQKDECFYTEKEINKESEPYKAPTGNPLEWVEEESYFFKLSAMQDQLLELYSSNSDFISPQSRMNEVVSFVKSGLEDISISRSTFDWGIKVKEGHVAYVWLDALSNYLSSIDYFNDNSQYKDFWPADVHLIGKDILRFHAVYWPAFLLAADIKPPSKIFAHGWWLKDGQKISKSLGNAINPIDIVEEYGLDQFRFFMMYASPFGNDLNFTHHDICMKSNELANDYGNLAQRTLSFIYSKLEGTLPPYSGELQDLDQEMLNKCINAKECFMDYIKKADVYNALHVAIGLAKEGNAYIDTAEPWAAYKSNDIMKANNSLNILLHIIYTCSLLLYPFIPNGASRILKQINYSGSLKFQDIGKLSAVNSTIKKPKPVFKKFDV